MLITSPKEGRDWFRVPWQGSESCGLSVKTQPSRVTLWWHTADSGSVVRVKAGKGGWGGGPSRDRRASPDRLQCPSASEQISASAWILMEFRNHPPPAPLCVVGETGQTSLPDPVLLIRSGHGDRGWAIPGLRAAGSWAPGRWPRSGRDSASTVPLWVWLPGRVARAPPGPQTPAQTWARGGVKQVPGNCQGDQDWKRVGR